MFQIELIHDQLPLAVPCYDLVPVTEFTLGPTYVETSGTPGSLDLTGGEYKTWERIHRGLADPRLLAIPASWSRVADSNPNWGHFFTISSESPRRCALWWPLYYVCSPGHQGPCWPGVILSFLPDLKFQSPHINMKYSKLRSGQYRVTLVTHNEGCVR